MNWNREFCICANSWVRYEVLIFDFYRFLLKLSRAKISTHTVVGFIGYTLQHCQLCQQQILFVYVLSFLQGLVWYMHWQNKGSFTVFALQHVRSDKIEYNISYINELSVLIPKQRLNRWTSLTIIFEKKINVVLVSAERKWKYYFKWFHLKWGVDKVRSWLAFQSTEKPHITSITQRSWNDSGWSIIMTKTK